MSVQPSEKVSNAVAKARFEVRNVFAVLERIASQKHETLHAEFSSKQPQTIHENKLTILKTGKHCIIGIWREVVVVTWSGETQVHHIEALHKILKALSLNKSIPIALVQLLHGNVKDLGDDTRNALRHLLKDSKVKIMCSAVVFEGSGFRGAAFRSIVTSLGVLLRLDYPHVAFNRIDRMSYWVAEQMSRKEEPHVFAKELETLIHHIRCQGQSFLT